MKPSKELIKWHGCANEKQFRDVISCLSDKRLVDTGLIGYLSKTKQNEIWERIVNVPNGKDFKFEIGKRYEIRLRGGQLCGKGYIKYVQQAGEILTEEQLQEFYHGLPDVQNLFRNKPAEGLMIFTQDDEYTNSKQYSSIYIEDNYFVKEI